MGTRDQPRRMRMLGHNVWLVQWLTFVIAAILGVGRRHALRLLQPVHEPARDLAAAIGRGLLMAILGGASTPPARSSAPPSSRWSRTSSAPTSSAGIRCSGVIFVVVIMFMPYGFVPGCTQLWRRLTISNATKPSRPRWRAGERPAHRYGAHAGGRRMTAPALEVSRSQQALRRPAGDPGRLAHGDAGRAPPDHRTERRRQDHAVQPDHRRPHRRQRLGAAVRPGAARHAHAAPRASRARPHLPDPHAVPARAADPQRRAGAARPRQAALEPVVGARPATAISTTTRTRSVGAGRASATAPSASWSKPPTASGAGSSFAMALAQKPKLLLLDEPLAGLSQGGAPDRCARCSTPSRATSPS